MMETLLEKQRLSDLKAQEASTKLEVLSKYFQEKELEHSK